MSELFVGWLRRDTRVRWRAVAVAPERNEAEQRAAAWVSAVGWDRVSIVALPTGVEPVAGQPAPTELRPRVSLGEGILGDSCSSAEDTTRPA
jgi:hypothetical protein